MPSSNVTRQNGNGTFSVAAKPGDWIQREPRSNMGHPATVTAKTAHEARTLLLTMLYGNILRVNPKGQTPGRFYDLRKLRGVPVVEKSDAEIHKEEMDSITGVRRGLPLIFLDAMGPLNISTSP